MLAGLERGLENLCRGMLAADELDHDIHRGICYHVVPVGGERLRRDAEFRRPLRLERACLRDAQVDAEGTQVLIAIARDGERGTAAYGSESNESHVHGARSFGHMQLLVLRMMRFSPAGFHQVGCVRASTTISACNSGVFGA